MKKGLILILSIFLSISLAFAVGFHSANEITSGTFDGDYNFITGRVGIGTESPTGVLEIKSTGLGTSPLRLRASGTDNLLWLITEDADGDGIITLRNKSNSPTVQIYSNGNSYFNGGRVGIGLTNPSRKLMVQDDVSAGYITEIYNENTGTDADGLIIRLGTGVPTGSNGFIEFRNGTTNRLGIITGDSLGGILYSTNSDKRLKKDIENVSNALKIVEQIRAVNFKFKNSENESIGFIAQELKQVYPYAVFGDENSDPKVDPMGVDYAKLTPILVAAIQEQQQEIQNLKERINLLEK